MTSESNVNSKTDIEFPRHCVGIPVVENDHVTLRGHRRTKPERRGKLAYRSSQPILRHYAILEAPPIAGQKSRFCAGQDLWTRYVDIPSVFGAEEDLTLLHPEEASRHPPPSGIIHSQIECKHPGRSRRYGTRDRNGIHGPESHIPR